MESSQEESEEALEEPGLEISQLPMPLTKNKTGSGRTMVRKMESRYSTGSFYDRREPSNLAGAQTAE